MQDGLVVEEDMIVKFPLIHFATCFLPLPFQGSFQQEEVKQPHWRDTKRPNIMNYVLPPEAPYYLPLAILPCWLEQCSHCGKNFLRKSSLLMAHGASLPSKILQDRCLAELMARRRTNFAIFKTRISFKEHMKKGAHLPAPGPASVECGFVSELMLLLDGISVGGTMLLEQF